MSSLSNILIFIDKIGISPREFEMQTGLANGTLAKYQERKKDVSTKNIDKISKRYAKELEEQGFKVIDLSSSGRDGEKAIVPNILSLDEEHTPVSRKLAGVNKKDIDPMEILSTLSKGFEAIAETMRSIERKMAREETLAKVQTNLESVLLNQDGGLGIVIELLQRDVRREAGGNPDKEAKILDEIVRRIGPALNSDVRQDIRRRGDR